MTIMGSLGEFTSVVKILFSDAVACVKVNGSLLELFKIGRRRGVRQGCPVAPYLFLITTKVLNIMVALEMEEGRVKGIK